MRSQDVPMARDLMTRSLVTLRPEMTISAAIRVLLANNISGAPVVNAEGGLLGLLSEFDCLRDLASHEYYEAGRAEATTVADLMSPISHTIPPELDLYGIAHEFVTRRVRRLPVVEAGRLVGQVSRRDVLGAIDRSRRGRRIHKRYPDYPADREPIHDYPSDR